MKNRVFVLLAATAFASLVFAQDEATPMSPAVSPTSPAVAAPAAPVTPQASTAKFRYGDIYSAEVTASMPSFQDENQDDKPMFERPAWAELIVKLEQGRGLGRFDFELEVDGTKIPCYAIATDSTDYSMKKSSWTIKKEDRFNYCRMLFPLDRAIVYVPGQTLLKGLLHFRLFDTKLQDTEVTFRILPPEQPLTPASRLRTGGSLGMTYKELTGRDLPDFTPADSAEPTKSEE